MDATRYTDFEQLVRMLNDAEIVPIVSGGFALEILSGYDLDSKIAPLIIEDDFLDDEPLIDSIMRAAKFERLDVPELVYSNFDNTLSVAYMPQSAVEPLIGHKLPGQFIFTHTEPEFRVLTTYDLYNLFGHLIGDPDRSEKLRHGDAQKLRFMKQLGYIFDRFPMRQMNATHPLIDVQFEFLTDKDFDKVDQVIRKAFDDANYSTGEEEKLVRRLRAGQPFGKRPIEIVAKRGDEVLGYVMVSGATVSDNRTGSSIGVVGPVVVDPLYRGRGIGWRLTQNAEIAARYDGYGVLAAIGWPGYWNQFGYIRSSEFGVTPAFEITPEFFMVKELYPSALLRTNGILRFPDEWQYDQE